MICAMNGFGCFRRNRLLRGSAFRNLGHFLARFHERQPLNVSISDAVVFGQDDLSVLPNLG